MRMIDADQLVQELNDKAAFESKREFTIGEIKALIRRQPTIQDDAASLVRQNGDFEWEASKC